MMRSFCAVALLTLAACGNQGGSPVVGVLKGAVTGLFKRGETPPPVATPTAQELRALTANGPAVRVTVPAFGTVAGAVPVGVNGEKVTWVAGDATFSTQFGFLLATRGLPEDLMAVEVDGFGPALSQGGNYTRQMEFLNGRDQIERKSFICNVSIVPNQSVSVLDKSYAATRYDDRCEGDGIIFTNQYWIDSSRQLRQTRQWVSETVGYLQTQQL